jgi:hypothetical protein
VSDRDGRFQFDAPDMTYPELDGLPARRPGLLIAAADGYGPDWVYTWGQSRSGFRSHWDPIKAAELTLTLARDDVPIHGRLLDRDGTPVAGASVRLSGLMVPRRRDLDDYLEFQRKKNLLNVYDFARSLSSPAVAALHGVTAEAVTDADGRFRLTGLGRERLAQLYVKGPGVVDTSLTVMTREAPDERPERGKEFGDSVVTLGAGFTLRLEPGRTVTGVVRDKANGEPIPGMWVGPDRDPLRGLDDGRYPTATDEHGRFTITGLSPERKGIKIMAAPQPGRLHFMAEVEVGDRPEVVIECPRGIPYRLRLVNEAGEPVEAEVTYHPVFPNPIVHQTFGPVWVDSRWPLSRAARQTDGTYAGAILAGPGVILAKTPRKAGYRPAHVDPKAFFAPGKTDWTSQDLISTYGNNDTVSIIHLGGMAWVDQHDYAAIVLTNPAADSGPLGLSATVVRDRPRLVTLVDPDGKPVVGAQSVGLTYHPWDAEPRLRASSFPITRLHPDRARRITFLKEDRTLIGFLLARGDGDSPYTVRMQPWATLTGRVVDEQGKPLGGGDQGKGVFRPSLAMDTRQEFAAHDDPDIGIFPGAEIDRDGRFRADRLVPGQAYTANIYYGWGKVRGVAFEGVKLAPGEVRDLGDLRAGPEVDVLGK